MKILVTGGTGFIGRYVVEELVLRGHDPVIFDRQDKNREHGEFFLGDITDAVAVTEGMAHADAFIHLAGVLGTQETINNPIPAAQTNIVGGLNVFEAAAQYGVPGVNIAVGNHWMNNTYSITKSTCERFIHMFNTERDTNITIVRALNAYGPRQVAAKPWGPSKVKKIMPAFVNAAIRADNISVYGDGTQIMDMIYVADVAQVLVSALERTILSGASDKVYEAGSGNPTTVNDIANEVIRQARRKSLMGAETIESKIVYVPMRPGEPEHSVVLGDPNTLAGLELRPFTSLSDGVAATIKYYRDNRTW